ncbi:MAG: flagellar hook-associated protein FlgK, partial [Rhizobacter sp.]|nr:flagellar hook-associated protein FlgK [Rhizobacter sp.]
DRKIDSLSSLVNVQVTDQADGSRNVTLRTGQPLVMGSTAATVSVTTNPDSSQTLKLKFATETFTLTTGSLGGQIGGLDDYERNTLDVMSTSISQVAQGITDSVNTALAAGYGTDPTVTTPGSGKPLFQYNPTTRQMSITPNLVTKDLAFSSNPATPGDSSVLQTIIGLQKQPLTNVTALGSVLLGDAYTQLMGRVATSSQQNNASLGTAETVRTQTQADWKSTSGVNQDEEAVNLIQYQQMYNANMKVIAVANQLFDSTLAILT